MKLLYAICSRNLSQWMHKFFWMLAEASRVGYAVAYPTVDGNGIDAHLKL